MGKSISELGSLNLGSTSISIGDLLEESKENTEEGLVTPQKEEEKIEEAVERVDSITMTPFDEWKMECESQGLELNDAASILDTVMTNEFYEESYRLAGRVFKLRTRTTIDADRLIEMVREINPDTSAVLAHLVSRINLSSSLAAFGEITFPHSYPTDENRKTLDEEWRGRWAYISSLPQPIFLALTQTLQRFDMKVNLSCDARSLENF